MPGERRPAAGGGRWVTVAPERLAGWLAGFAQRHGSLDEQRAPAQVVFQGRDGARAEVGVPFPPLRGDLVEHVLRRRLVGVLLVRLGGFACGVFDGDELVDSKVGRRPVHGRAAPGGSSQARFARRREGQARRAWDAAADTAARVLAPRATGLEAVVVGGDRTSVDAVLADRRLAPLRPLVTGRLLEIPDPRLEVLRSAPAQFRAVRIRVRDP